MSGGYRDATPKQPSCPLCGCTTLVEGKVRGNGLVFVPEDAGLLGSVFAVGFGLRAKKCAECHNVQLFAAED